MEEKSKSQTFNLEELNALKKQDIAEHPYVKGRFVSILTGIHRMTESDAEATYEREALFYKNAVSKDEKLRKCSNVNLFSVFLEVAINNLSLQSGGKADAFIETRNNKTIRKDEDGKPVEVWETTPSLNISTYGELKMRMRAGQILRMNNPVVIYDGDRFQPRTNERGEMTIDYAPAIPRKSNTIIGCWVSMHLPGGFIDFKWLLKEDIDRLAKYSIPKRGENPRANALYSSNNGQIDTGFLEAKTIKHAMRTCPKIRTSDSVSFDGEEDIEAPEMSGGTFDAPEVSAGAAAPQATQIEDDNDIF
jgi:recombinational DNA repair protein RecT